MNETTYLTPIQLASKLEQELKPITNNNVPPQMIYNYITNNVRNIHDYITPFETTNKSGKKIQRNLFKEEDAIAFIEVMVTSAKARIAKRNAKKEKKES